MLNNKWTSILITDNTFQSNNKSTLQYRADLDGLRGLAVLQVILFHAGIGFFSGGYIGVDVFFVLSGFLITSIINEQINTNRFTFSRFYLSRIRRLLPAFLVFLIASTMVASYLLVPDDYITFVRSAKNAILFTSNSFFDKLTDSYFAPDSEKLHLLHTWSLSIEWQFYLIWPAMFFILRRFLSQKISTLIVIALFIVSGWHSYHLTITQAEHSYYLFSARIFEMLAGASLALTIQKLPRLPKMLAHILSIISIVALLIISIQYTAEFLFPGLNALWVCLATMAFIYAGNNNPFAAGNAILSIKPMAIIGTLSYSLYLWHWPIFAFLRVLNIELTMPTIVTAIMATFTLSFLTWQFIEKPFRFKHTYSLWKTVVIFWLIPALFFVAFSKLTKNHNGLPARLGDQMIRITNTISSVVTPNIDSCNPPQNFSITECRLGSINTNNPNKLDAILIGDSHARHFREFVDVLGKDAGWSIYGVTAPACLPIPNITRWNDNNYCRGGIVKHVYDVIEKHKPTYIIMAQNWLGYAEGSNMIYTETDERSVKSSQRRIEESILRAMDIFAKNGATPIIIKPAPSDEIDYKHCFYQHIRERRDMRNDECIIDTNDELKNTAKIFTDQLFGKIAARYPSTIFIDPRRVQCEQNKCFTSIDGIPIYEDQEHINNFASRWLAEQYLKKYGNPLKTANQ